MKRDDIAELTVEDPSEAFEDLRDKCDLRMLFKHRAFLTEAYGLPDDVDMDGGSGVPSGRGKLGPPADKEWVERWRRKLKMAGVRIAEKAICVACTANPTPLRLISVSSAG